MFELELHQARSTELHRRAEAERLAREAVRGRRAARREEAARRAAGTGPDTRRPHQDRLTRAA
ncbi:hypothetical protein ABZX30_31750 [Streptomyces sp. NPDC004542]|uniref:hypothetical protein n=1 Tax=Streptomyces sp. NPDC004542 TaxID=3154281 RepID=UPI0033A6DDD4